MYRLSKKAIIRDLQAELASRNRDLWALTDQMAELRRQCAILEAAGIEQEKEILLLEKEIESWPVTLAKLEELCHLQRRS